MGHRIEDGYREKLRALLASVPTRLDVEWLMARARRAGGGEGASLDRSLAATYARVRAAVAGRLAAEAAPEAALGGGARTAAASVGFLCDASLGGLARWLRAAGYPAEGRGVAAAAGLVEEAGRRGLVLVTSDHRVLERRSVRSGSPVAVWVPSRLGRIAQLGMVLRDLALPLRDPLCMSCGGALRPVAKSDVQERIPPRTARWKDDYFVCGRCGKLFWHGTHWERIARRLAEAVPAPQAAPAPRR